MKTTLISIALVLALCGAAQADPTDVSFGGKWCFRITAATGGFSAPQRVIELTNRVNLVTNDPDARANGVTLSYLDLPGDAVGIYYRDHLLLTVTANDAATTSVGVEELARQWGNSLQTAVNEYIPQVYPRETVTPGGGDGKEG